MKASIRTKLLLFCTALVFLTALGISGTYFVLLKQEKQRDYQERIQIAFDIIFEDMSDRFRAYSGWLAEFVKNDTQLGVTAYMYNNDADQLKSLHFAMSYLLDVAQVFKSFGHLSSLDRLALYGDDKRLLVEYHRKADQEITGAFVVSGSGDDAYLLLDEPAQLSAMMFKKHPIPNTPLPPDIPPRYEAELPDAVAVDLMRERGRVLFRITVPVYQQDLRVGVVVGDIFYTQQDMEKYAALSKTEVNLFAQNSLSVGTLPVQDVLSSDPAAQNVTYDALKKGEFLDIVLYSVSLDGHVYYQGQCGFQGVGAITVSLSQQIEQQAIEAIAVPVLFASGCALVVTFVLSLIFTQNTLCAIENIVAVIGLASEGDLRNTTQVVSQDEIGMLAGKLNQMIRQLRGISSQVQESSQAVDVTADAILVEIERLAEHMRHQSTSVDNAAVSVDNINQFISSIDNDTHDLLTATEQIVASVNENRTNRAEVALNIGELATNLQIIFASIEQVSESAKHVSGHSERLENVVRQTEVESRQIGESLNEVSQNADHSQNLAEETKQAALNAQETVERSIEGMQQLKDVVAGTADIIREVASWGGQVNSILDIVDNITEQTSLLALNASIISAQAGEQGRGFAVVANEIKELATRTKLSTQEIASLLHALQKKTEEGVKNTNEGLLKADQGVRFAFTVKEALDTILSRATRSSERAAETADVLQTNAASSKAILDSMRELSDMVALINTAIYQQEQDLNQVVTAVEKSQSMSEQINLASAEQNAAGGHIQQGMDMISDRLGDISRQTEQLRSNSHQIVDAMQTIELITENILHNTVDMSGKTASNLVAQSETLQQIVSVFKVSS